MTLVLHVKDAEYGWMAYQQSDNIDDFPETHRDKFWQLLRNPLRNAEDYSGSAYKRVGKYLYEVFE
jgi:hypothetical protein